MKGQTHNNSTEKTIYLSFKDLEIDKKRALFQLLINTLISGFLYVTVVLSIQSMFKIYNASHFVIVPGLLIILILNSFYNNKKLFSRISWIVILLLIGCFVFLNSYMLNGLFLILNQVIEVIGEHTGIFIKQYDIALEIALQKLAISIFLAVFSSIIAYLCCYLVRHAAHLLIWIFIIPLFMIQLVIGITPELYYNLALFLVSAMIASYSFVIGSSRKKQIGKSKHTIIFFSTSIVLGVSTITFLLLNVIEPLSGYTKNSTVLSIKQAILHKVEDFRYEEDKTNTLTQGDFQQLGELKLEDTPALKVVMSKPTSLYLRGYVGSTYTSEAWETLDYHVYNDSYGLFYWLRKYQFNALNQLSSLNDLTSNKDEENISITINNVNANSKYLYVPYELRAKPDSFKDVYTYDDSMIMSKDFFGNRLYKYQSSDNIVKKYPSVANDLYQLSDDHKKESYLKNESYYNEYIYHNYLQIPKDTMLVLQNHFEKVKNLKDERLPYETIIKNVKSDVKDAIIYNEETKPLPDSEDFIQYLLEESGEGYATHFATLATLLFRSYGVPARYVEGYLITPKDVKNVEDYEEIVVTGQNAHAWTEIYIDQIGWIPIEVTPSYYDVMEEADFSNYPKRKLDASENNDSVGNSSNEDHLQRDKINSSKLKQHVKDDEPIPNNSLLPKSKEELSLLFKLVISMLIVISCLIIAYIIFALKKLREVKNRNKEFQDLNYHISIPKMFSYSLTLLHYDGLSDKGGSILNYLDELENKYGKEYAQNFKTIVAIHQECIYSNNKIEKEKYDQMKEFMNETYTKVVKSKNILQRLKMKLWDFIY